VAEDALRLSGPLDPGVQPPPFHDACVDFLPVSPTGVPTSSASTWAPSGSSSPPTDDTIPQIDDRQRLRTQLLPCIQLSAIPEKAVSRADPTRFRTELPLAPGGWFAFKAAIDLEPATRGMARAAFIAKSSSLPAISAASTKQLCASLDREHHNSSWASVGHCFVGYFEGA